LFVVSAKGHRPRYPWSRQSSFMCRSCVRYFFEFATTTKPRTHERHTHTLFGVVVDIGCHGGWCVGGYWMSPKRPRTTNQSTDRPTSQPPRNQCQGSPNPRAKTSLLSWWIFDVIVASVSVVCRGWPPPPNSGHMSDTSSTSNIFHCLLLLQPGAKDQETRAQVARRDVRST